MPKYRVRVMKEVFIEVDVEAINVNISRIRGLEKAKEFPNEYWFDVHDTSNADERDIVKI
jgi:hypothetical protein